MRYLQTTMLMFLWLTQCDYRTLALAMAPHHAIGLEADSQPFVQPWDCAVIGLFLVGRHVGACYLQTATPVFLWLKRNGCPGTVLPCDLRLAQNQPYRCSLWLASHGSCRVLNLQCSHPQGQNGVVALGLCYPVIGPSISHVVAPCDWPYMKSCRIFI